MLLEPTNRMPSVGGASFSSCFAKAAIASAHTSGRQARPSSAAARSAMLAPNAIAINGTAPIENFAIITF
jgi:hypothetical protein